jgi:hypothetical protein
VQHGGAASGSRSVLLAALPTPEDATRADQRAVATRWVEAAAGALTRMCPHCGSVEHGRPSAPGRFVSLSYTRGLVLVALAEAPVGVDVERDGPVVPGFADTAAWTRAEALLKASGEGLRRGPTAAEDVTAWAVRLDLPTPYVGWVAVLGTGDVAVSWAEGAPAARSRTATDPAAT